MSDYWIILIPAQADFIPTTEARRDALRLFRALAPRAAEVKEELTEDVRFIDCGSNFEHVRCPDCDEELKMAWWQEKMDEEAKGGFPLRSFDLPCCDGRSSLERLKYDWPQGFARFSIEAEDPIIADLTVEQLQAFEAILGCRVRRILRHI